ncbi:MAG: sulfatase-like hydrolase/transferase [Planctomycetes bacterium]|jgi:glucan phosphoethanolaminetransferase (alkaline phosphatase superfamily)|nr:sulfatase-like hydrolase/transferase [Planctomycetota bacterium]HPY75378.1 sulfatase-like hydrolase/transferase [Planctomycetota bacterium]HQB01008.1 sulfatase-like hydrolase/transferase [Planctomycetota bacterium]
MFFATSSYSTKRNIIYFICFYIVFTLLFFFLDPGYRGIGEYLGNIGRKNGEIWKVIYVILYLCMSLVGVLIFLSEWKWLQIVGFVGTFISMGVFMAYQKINAYGYYLDEAVDMLHWGTQYADDAIGMFYDRFILSTSICIGITLFLIVILRWMPKIRGIWSLGGATLLCGIIFSLGNVLYLAFFSPMYFKVSLISYLAIDPPYYQGNRKPVTLEHNTEKKFPNIFLVVDESIRGDYLSINNEKMKSTPFLQTLPLFNWGICSAAGNTSAISNLVLQTGLRFHQIPDSDQISLQQPHIFQYAKKAGYRVIFIEGQNPTSMPVNFMRQSDLQYVDEYVQLLKGKINFDIMLVDHLIAQKMVEIAQDPRPTFTYVNKMGCHFHYENRYPDSARHLQPTLTSSQWMPNLTLIENSYQNAIRWNVDEFFRIFYEGTKTKDCLLFYTSDHGQSFFENNIPSPTNMVVDAPISQANVPLFVLATGKSFTEFQKIAQKSIENQKNTTSHFQIFSSVLHCIGYENQTGYDISLFQNSWGKRQFISGNVYGIGIYVINDF